MNIKVVTFEIAKVLNKMGFDLPTFKYYVGSGELCSYDHRLEGILEGDYLLYNFNSFKNNYKSFKGEFEEHYSAPTYDEVKNWLRTEFNINIAIINGMYKDKIKYIPVLIGETTVLETMFKAFYNDILKEQSEDKMHNTYESALHYSIIVTLDKLIKNFDKKC